MDLFKKIAKWVGIVLACVLGLGIAFGAWQGRSANGKVDDLTTVVTQLKTDHDQLKTDHDLVVADVATKASLADVAALRANVVSALADKADKTDLDALRVEIGTALADKADKTDLDALRVEIGTALADKADRSDLAAATVAAEKKFATYGWAKANMVSKTQAEGFARNSALDSKASKDELSVVKHDVWVVAGRVEELEAAAAAPTDLKVEVK